MYDREDVAVLTDRFLEVIEQKKNRKENQAFSHTSGNNAKGNTRKLTRDEELKKGKLDKNEFKLIYSDFLKIILDF
jgi:hypothetical protein